MFKCHRCTVYVCGKTLKVHNIVFIALSLKLVNRERGHSLSIMLELHRFLAFPIHLRKRVTEDDALRRQLIQVGRHHPRETVASHDGPQIVRDDQKDVRSPCEGHRQTAGWWYTGFALIMQNYNMSCALALNHRIEPKVKSPGRVAELQSLLQI